jgi:hypothetical protein
MDENQKQVEVSHYSNISYLSLVRSVTHWLQAYEIAKRCEPGSHVLEIGPGCGHTTWILKLWGFKVTTLDFDPDISPDIVADLTTFHCNAPAYDAVIAAEVLEHLPYDQFEVCLANIRKATKNFALITLPAPLVGLSVGINLPKVDTFAIHLGLPLLKPHQFDGEHYWELGKWGYPKRKILASMKNQAFNVTKHFRPLLSLKSYFFVLEKADS